MAYGRFGPTEARIALIVGNTLLVLVGPGAAFGANLVGAGIGVGMIVLLARRFGRNLRRLARVEPGGGGLRNRPAPAGERGDMAPGLRGAGVTGS